MIFQLPAETVATIAKATELRAEAQAVLEADDNLLCSKAEALLQQVHDLVWPITMAACERLDRDELTALLDCLPLAFARVQIRAAQLRLAAAVDALPELRCHACGSHINYDPGKVPDHCPVCDAYLLGSEQIVDEDD